MTTLDHVARGLVVGFAAVGIAFSLAEAFGHHLSVAAALGMLAAAVIVDLVRSRVVA